MEQLLLDKLTDYYKYQYGVVDRYESNTMFITEYRPLNVNFFGQRYRIVSYHPYWFYLVHLNTKTIPVRFDTIIRTFAKDNVPPVSERFNEAAITAPNTRIIRCIFYQENNLNLDVLYKLYNLNALEETEFFELELRAQQAMCDLVYNESNDSFERTVIYVQER